MINNPYQDGYHAGLVNDRECPHAMWSLAFIPWHIGNGVGLDIHCAVVEAVYLKHLEDETPQPKETLH